jgi:peptidoglycan/xylan/chitin deacetylase (PgdA/CDA1 family)
VAGVLALIPSKGRREAVERRLRTLVKPVSEWLLANSLARVLGRKRRRRQRLILAYHNVIATGALPLGEQSLHLRFDDFRKQLDHLMKWGTIGTLARVLADPSDEPLIALTFDDAYAGAVHLALPELERRGVPATMFVAPGLLGQPGTWWDLLGMRPGGLDAASREYCLSQLDGDQSRIMEWATEPSADAIAEFGQPIASAEELARAARWEGLTLGAHSYHHPNLARISPSQLDFEVKAPLRWLRQQFPRQARPWLAYPYGRYNDRVGSAVSAAGYEAAFMINGGWFRVDGYSTTTIPRLNIPAGISTAGFSARLNGLVNFWTAAESE